MEKFHQLVSQMVALMVFFYHGRIRKKHHQLQKIQVEFLSKSGWWFQPIWKILVKLESSPIFGVKIKNIWNHHLDQQLKKKHKLNPLSQFFLNPIAFFFDHLGIYGGPSWPSSHPVSSRRPTPCFEAPQPHFVQKLGFQGHQTLGFSPTI